MTTTKTQTAHPECHSLILSRFLFVCRQGLTTISKIVLAITAISDRIVSMLRVDTIHMKRNMHGRKFARRQPLSRFLFKPSSFDLHSSSHATPNAIPNSGKMIHHSPVGRLLPPAGLILKG